MLYKIIKIHLNISTELFNSSIDEPNLNTDLLSYSNS